MAKEKKFPKFLFVTSNKFSDGSGGWLSAHRDQIEAVEDEDKTSSEVALYTLTKINRLEIVKTVRFIGLQKGRK